MGLLSRRALPGLLLGLLLSRLLGRFPLRCCQKRCPLSGHLLLFGIHVRLFQGLLSLLALLEHLRETLQLGVSRLLNAIEVVESAEEGREVLRREDHRQYPRIIPVQLVQADHARTACFLIGGDTSIQFLDLHLVLLDLASNLLYALSSLVVFRRGGFHRFLQSIRFCVDILSLCESSKRRQAEYQGDDARQEALRHTLFPSPDHPLQIQLHLCPRCCLWGDPGV